MVNPPVRIRLFPPMGLDSACTLTANPGALSFGTLRRTRIQHPTTPAAHSATVDERTTPGTYSISGSFIEEVTAGQRGLISLTTGNRQAFIQFTIPATLEHTDPPDDANPVHRTSLPVAITLSYHVGASMTGDMFTRLDGCTAPCSKSYAVPKQVTHEYAAGGTLTIDEVVGPGAHPKAVDGDYEATINISVSCPQ